MKYALGNMLNGAGGLNADQLALDLPFAVTKSLTAAKGPTPTFTRASSGTFVGSNGLIQSAGNNVARFDHDPVTLASKGLLIEESRTNILIRSAEFGSTAWTRVNISETLVLSPDGTTTASSFNDGTSTGEHAFYGAFNPSNRPITGAVTCTLSVFLKAGTRRYVLISASDFTNGAGLVIDTQTWSITDAKSVGTGWTYISSRITNYRSDWFRAELTFTPPSATGVIPRVSGSVTSTFSTLTASYLGTGATFIAWGAQLETGSFATSYIPTTTSSVVRSADVCSISGAGFTGMWNALEGSLFTSAIFNAPVAYGTGQLLVDVNDTTAANRLRYFRNPTTGVSGFANTSSGSLNVSITSVSATQPSVTQKYSAGFKLDDYVFYVNNSQIGTDNLGAMIVSPTTLTIGDASAGALRQYTNGTISSIRYYRKRLPNAKLQALTV